MKMRRAELKEAPLCVGEINGVAYWVLLPLLLECIVGFFDMTRECCLQEIVGGLEKAGNGEVGCCITWVLDLVEYVRV